MTWKVEIDAAALKQLSKIDSTWRRRITSHLREISGLPDPRSRGKALAGDMAGLWRYRVGDYRIVCHLHDDVLIVEVVKVAHRRHVYD